MIRSSTNTISIRPKVSGKVKLLILLAALLALLAVVIVSFNFGVRSGHEQYQQDKLLIDQLNNSVKELQENVRSAQEQMIYAERQKQIQEEAYKQMSNAYASSEQKNSYLGSRLDFYRSIISPEGGQSGPAIQAIEYRPETGESGNNIAFDVTLVQAIKHKFQVTGNLSAQLYVGDELIKQWPESGTRSVNYQYFQQISGLFESVADLENASISVTLNLHDGTILKRSFLLDDERLDIKTEDAS